LKCCVARNPFSDQQYLCAATPNSIILMQWYQPMQKFMMVNVFDYTMPSLLTVFEPIVLKDHEYPELIIAVHEE
jgi:hypothetical protein